MRSLIYTLLILATSSIAAFYGAYSLAPFLRHGLSQMIIVPAIASLFLACILRFVNQQRGLRNILVSIPLPLSFISFMAFLIGGPNGLAEDPFTGMLIVTAFSLAPLIGCTILMGVGYTIETENWEDVVPHEVNTLPSLLKILLFTAALSSVFVCFIMVSRVHVTAMFNLHPVGVWLIMTFAFTYLSDKPKTLREFLSPDLDRLADSALIAALVFCSISLVKMLLMMSEGFEDADDLLATMGPQVASGWLGLVWAAVIIVVSNTFLSASKAFDSGKVMKRNWHFTELYGFFVLLTIAPPTIIDFLN